MKNAGKSGILTKNRSTVTTTASKKRGGLVVASRFPIFSVIHESFLTKIKRKQFQFFGNGVGVDALGSKGIFGVKLDLSAIVPAKFVCIRYTLTGRKRREKNYEQKMSRRGR